MWGDRWGKGRVARGGGGPAHAALTAGPCSGPVFGRAWSAFWPAASSPAWCPDGAPPSAVVRRAAASALPLGQRPQALGGGGLGARPRGRRAAMEGRRCGARCGGRGGRGDGTPPPFSARWLDSRAAGPCGGLPAPGSKPPPCGLVCRAGGRPTRRARLAGPHAPGRLNGEPSAPNRRGRVGRAPRLAFSPGVARHEATSRRGAPPLPQARSDHFGQSKRRDAT
jgi:hypothetical protein